ncbi:MAG: prepilin-type N-terminal cleavage/methylation domain-containing protein [Actinomycetes bacterium]
MNRSPSKHQQGRRRQSGITLVELLIAMTIMTIVTTMIVTAWISLQGSYASTVKSADARETARDSMSRMRREIRDAMTQPSTGLGPVVAAENNHIQIMSAFNDTGGDVQSVDYWYRATSATTGNITRKRGAGPEQILAENIVNVASNTPLFKYSYLDSAGNVTVATSVAAADVPRILTVEVHILADVNPGHSPTYMELISTVQPRNQRQY